MMNRWLRSAAQQPAPGGDGEDAPAPEVEITRLDGRADPWALGLLLTGHDTGHQATVDHFLRFADEYSYPLDQLWVLRSEGQPQVASLVVPSPGRTGMLFLTPLPGPQRVEQATTLLGTVVQEADTQRTSLLQALLDPNQAYERQAMERAGFSHLADLLYMQRRAPRGHRSAALPPGFTMHTWHEDLRPRFAKAILDSYVDTLDCPGLVGLRDVNDILEGHKASGQFDPNLWFLVEAEPGSQAKADGAGGGLDPEPVGVMLLNASPSHRALEVVYFGLSPSHRGQGIGQLLLEYGLSKAQERDLNQIILAVDEANGPALRLYRRLGFIGHTRKVAMLRQLG